MSLNNFEIGKLLGKGSFGSVNIVTRKLDKKIYAIFIIFNRLIQQKYGKRCIIKR